MADFELQVLLFFQGDFLDQAVELILKQFKSVKKGDIMMIEAKKKVPYFDDEDDEDESG